jgi:hypothetical protein
MPTTSIQACTALPHDVLPDVIPLTAPEQWRTTVVAAGYRCQCGGRCGRSHRKYAGRCEKSMRGPAGVRLFALPAASGSSVLVALCDRCADGYRTAERREQTAAAAQRADEAPSLLDLLTAGED